MANLSLYNATIGIVTVLPEEFAAACVVLGCNDPATVNGRHYRLGNLKRFDQQQSHFVAVCQASDMGTSTIAARAALMFQDCQHIRTVIMCGIAGAVPNPQKPSEHVRLGDIVAVNRKGVVQYDFVKVTATATEDRCRWSTPSIDLLNAVQQLIYLEKLGERPWEKYITAGIEELEIKGGNKTWRRPSEEDDLLREFDAKPESRFRKLARYLGISGTVTKATIVPHPYDEERTAGVPRVFHGVIASANSLQKNPQRRNYLRDHFRAMAIEMEGAGLGDAAFESGRSFFVVRGTCDYCNEDKNDLWHNYAAIVAAAYTRALLEQLPPQPILINSATLSSEINNAIAIHTASRLNDWPVEAVNLSFDLESNLQSDSIVQPEINQTLDEMLHTQAAESVKNIESFIDDYEMSKAFSEAAKLQEIVLKFESRLQPEMLKEIYSWLARVEIIKGRVNGNIDEHMNKASEFLAKAKNVTQ